MSEQQWVIPFDRLGIGDVHQVGGKNASLGEMIRELAGAGVRVPGGVATTAFAFREFLSVNGLDVRIRERLAGLDIDDVTALARGRVGNPTVDDRDALSACAPRCGH